MSEINVLPWSVVQKLQEVGIPQDSLIFYQNNRWVYKTGPSVPDETESLSSPIDSLGPFDIHSVDVSFILYPEEQTYKIIKIGNKEFTEEKQATGIFAPIAPITLDKSVRSIANIPDNATHFCWLYPPSINHINNDLNLNNEYEVNLLKIGGFAYFHYDQTNSGSLQLVRVNSLIVSATNGLTFEGPHPWRKQFTNNLWAKNRFQPVTLTYLIEKGARYFAFINPYESLFDDNGQSSWMPSPHGAFVYLFNEDHSPNSHDCYFSVSDDFLGVAPSD